MKKIKILFLLLLLFIMTGCGSRKNSNEKEYTIYVVDKDDNKVDSYTKDINVTDAKEVLQVLFAELQKHPEKAIYKSAIPEDVTINSYSLNEKRLVLNLSGTYLNMNPFQEVLSRAAIVRTLCQIDEIEYVSFEIEGEPLVNSDGFVVGMMSAEQFVDNAGDEINAYEKAELTLYFANETGDMLKPYKTSCVYNSNISLDKLVVEKLIEGPEDSATGEQLGPTVSDDTQILSVTTQDGVCYVNLTQGVQIRVGNVTPEVAIYSIVNSLLELPGVNRVQFSIEGNSEINYMEKISLAQPLEKDMDIVDDAQ